MSQHAATIMRGPRLRAIYCLVAVAALWSLAPTQVARADHCGGRADVDPAVGRVGTEFVFTTNLGAPSTLRLFHNGQPARAVPLNGDGDVSYTFVSQPGDEGSWAATAETRSAPFCRSNDATFTVVPRDAGAVPTSPTASPSSSGGGSNSVSTPPSVALAVMAVFALVVLTYWAILRFLG